MGILAGNFCSSFHSQSAQTNKQHSIKIRASHTMVIGTSIYVTSKNRTNKTKFWMQMQVKFCIRHSAIGFLSLVVWVVGCNKFQMDVVFREFQRKVFADFVYAFVHVFFGVLRFLFLTN